MRLNLRRGLNRLFIVFMIGWYAIASFGLWPQWRKSLSVPLPALQQSAPKVPPGYELVDPPPTDSFVPSEPPRKPVTETAFFALVPVVLYGIGLSAQWVFKGFRPDAEARQVK